jgi:hypothetical protein
VVLFDTTSLYFEGRGGGVKWSTIYLQESTIYLQFPLHLIVDSEREGPISGLRFNCNRQEEIKMMA